MANCPKCEVPVFAVDIEAVTLSAENGLTWRGLSYGCQQCKALLSVSIDPTALGEDIAASVVEALRKR
jgi:hypothetical protein